MVKFLGNAEFEGDLDLNNNDLLNQNNAPSGGGGLSAEFTDPPLALDGTQAPIIITETPGGAAFNLPDNATHGIGEGHFQRIINASGSTCDILSAAGGLALAAGQVVDLHYTLTGGVIGGPRWRYFVYNTSTTGVLEEQFGGN